MEKRKTRKCIWAEKKVQLFCGGEVAATHPLRPEDSSYNGDRHAGAKVRKARSGHIKRLNIEHTGNKMLEMELAGWRRGGTSRI